jgi:radical SAM superfamily enzyme YgiQ (UPF0313 family)
MNVGLIQPPTDKIIDPTLYPPTGLMYLAASLDKYCPEHTYAIRNLAGSTMDEAEKAVQYFDIVGLYLVSPYWDTAKELAGRCPNIVIGGGPHATVETQTVLDSGLFDAVFLGQAENSIVKYFKDLKVGAEQKVYAQIDSGIDTLPMPRLFFGHSDRGVLLLSSRGCINKCAFCSGGICFERVQLHSVERVIQEVDRLISVGKTKFRFLDDMFAISKIRLVELCKRLKERDVHWSCHTRVDRIEPETMAMMVEAGCYEVGLGIESFDDSVLETCNKRITAKQNAEAIRVASNAGVVCHIYMMIGTPGETAQTADINIEQMTNLRGHYGRIQFSTFMPFPGSPAWANPAKYKIEIIDRDYTKYNQHQYVRSASGVVQLPLWSPVRIRGLAEADQMENLRKMRAFISEMQEYRTLRIPK